MGKKADLISSYSDKSREWLVEKLATTTMQCNSYKDRYYTEMKKVEQLRRENDSYIVTSRTVLKKNDALAEVLRFNGIMPRKLIIEYVARDCHKCKHADFSKCMCVGEDPECGAEDNYYGEKCEYKTVIESVSFYCFTIDSKNDPYDFYKELGGIMSSFERNSYDVLKVIDAATNAVLYECPDEEDSKDETDRP